MIDPRRDRLALGLAFVLGPALGGCAEGGAPAPVDSVEVRILAHQASWEASYLLPGAEVRSGREIHVPLGATVRLELASRDYLCQFSAPELGLRDFAAPDLPGEFRFRAEQVGSYDLRGDEFCGLPHTDKSRGRVLVEPPDAFRSWVREREQEARE